MLILDHLVVSGETRDAATAHLAAQLGVDPVPGGAHAVFHTHNTLLGMGPDFYVEAIAIDPNAPKPDRPRWYNLDQFAGAPRLTNWAVATDDIHAALATLGPGYGQPVALRRGDLRWQMAVPDTGLLPFDGLAPAIIQWAGSHPAPCLPDCGLRLEHLQVQHPKADQLVASLAPLLNDPRIAVAPGPARLQAQFIGPQGPVILT